jgi:hypothetical protein
MTWQPAVGQPGDAAVGQENAAASRLVCRSAGGRGVQEMK